MKRKDDSVPGFKGFRDVPEKEWEHRYSLWAPSPEMKRTNGSDFNPKRSNERETTHLKVNKEDH